MINIHINSTNLALPVNISTSRNVSEKSPLFSIITINRNNAENLPRTISSLEQIRQDLDVECIFIDGASSDESVTLAKALWSDDNIVSESDNGIYDAMNKGLAMAKGKFILWLNSGDELITGVWKDAKKILQTTDATVISFGLEIYNESGTKLLERRLPNERMLPRRTLPHPSSIFQRDIILRLGGYDESFRIAADRFLFLRLHHEGASFYFPKIFLSKFYLGGASSRFFDTFFENRRIDHHFKIISPWTYSVIRMIKRVHFYIEGNTTKND